MDHHKQMLAMRRAAGLSQRELAEKIGKTHATVGYVERGENETTLETAIAWAEACGFRLRWEADPEAVTDSDGRSVLAARLMRVVGAADKRTLAMLKALADAELSHRGE